MKYIVLLVALFISSCSLFGTSDEKDDIPNPELGIEYINEGEGESFSSF